MNEISIDFLTILLPSYLFFYLAIRLFVRNHKSQLNRLVSFLMLSLLFYFLGEYSKAALFPPDWEAQIVLYWNAPMLLLSISLLNHICLLVGGPISIGKKRFIPAVYGTPFLLLAILLASFSPNDLYDIDMDNGPSPLHPLLLALALFFVAAYILSSVAILLVSWIKSKEPRRKKLLLRLLLGLLLLFAWLFLVTMLLQLSVLSSPSAMSYYFTGLFIWTLGIQQAISKYDFLPDFRRRFRSVFQSAQAGIIMLDSQGAVRDMNPSARRMFEQLQSKAGKVNVADHLYFEDGTRLTEQLTSFMAAQKTGSNWEMTLRIDRNPPADLIVNLDRIVEAEESLLVLHLTDVTILKETQRRLEESERNYRYLAYHDSLTGLCNRAFIHEKINQYLAEGERFALTLIDLDGFKAINDSHGHLVGDDYLKHIASVLKRRAQEGDVLGRIGGDEFIVIIPLEEQASIDMAEKAARMRLSALASEPFVHRHLKLPISFSAGISLYPCHASNIEELMRMADEAMYVVKRTGKNNIAVYGKPSRSRVFLKA